MNAWGRNLRLAALGALLALAGCAGTGGLAGGAPPASQQAAFEKQLALGQEYLRQGNLQRAKLKLKLALETRPGSGLALTSLGLAHQLAGEDAEAEQRFKAALQSEPGLAEARNNYGVYLLSRRRPEEAVQQLAAAAGNSGYRNRGSALENLGRAHLMAGDRQAARQVFRQATQLNPAQAGALLALAELAYHGADYAQASGYYRRHQAVARPSARSLWLCVRLSRALGASEQEASCGSALGAFPASQEYLAYQESL